MTKQEKEELHNILVRRAEAKKRAEKQKEYDEKNYFKDSIERSIRKSFKYRKYGHI